jgi:ribonuclease Z
LKQVINKSVTGRERRVEARNRCSRADELIDVEVLHSVSAVGTQILLTHNKEHVIVDAGDGTVRDLVSRGVDFERIGGMLLTHEHFDHFSGLYGLLHFCRLQRREDEFILAVPTPAKVIDHLLKSPIMYEPLPFTVRLIELGDGESVVIGGLKATAFAVSHGSAKAFGYSIEDDEGFRVVASGDTVPCVSLQRQVDGADVAVLEATYADGSADLASKYGHMTRSQAQEVGQKAKRTILIHSNPERYFGTFQCAVR